MAPRLSTTERQKQIIDEAIRIIYERGYSSLSVRNLAKRVGISEPAIYRHFESKEDIILGILDRMLDFGKMLERNIKNIKDEREKIRRLIFLQVDYLEKNPHMASIIFSEDIFQPDKRVDDKLQEIFENRHKLLNEIVSEAEKKGININIEIDDLSSIIFGYLHLVVFKWRRSNFKFSLSEKAERLVQIIDKIIFD